MKNKIINIIENEEGLFNGDLRHYFKLVFTAPNVSKPYHNFRHMIHVTLKAYEAAKYHEYHITYGPRHLRALLIAALFHDYAHTTMESGKDGDNIVITLEFLQKNILAEDLDLYSEIKNLIQATQYPHVAIQDCLGTRIIRDADMSQSFSKAWMQQVIFGLAEELKCTPMKLLKHQKNFLNSIHFETEWGRKNYEAKRKDRIEEVEELLMVLT